MSFVNSLFLIFRILVSAVYSIPLQGQLAKRCTNSAADRGCWGEYDITTNYYDISPDTGVTKEYWFDITNTTAAPDGIERIVLSVNGSIPGPTIVADWGDTVVVHVTNRLTTNGTGIHFHGIRQNYTNQNDGVPSVTQCATAPGDSITYTWKATQYGSTWYHSHFSLQAWDGVFGGIVINGPATSNYDEDLGPLFLTDWGHQTADNKFWEASYTGPPPMDNGLINGTNVYNDNGTVVGSRFETTFQSGKSYRLRLINSANDSHFKFSVDNHTMTVIANDLVPIVPYETDVLSIAIGQRYDVIVNATASPGNYWMRAIPCSKNANEHNIRGIIRYDASSTDDPESRAWGQTVSVCEDEDSSNFVPYLSLDAGEEDYQVLLNVMLKTNPFRWYINDTTMAVEWDNPTLKQIYLNQTDWEPREAVYELTTANEWAYIIVHSSAGGAHPIHLHGHDFYVLASGNGNYYDSTPLQTHNPPRRDVALLPANGHLVIAFKADNPGAWLMHCHIGWHTEQGFSIQIVERAAELRNVIDYDALNRTCANWDAFTAKTGLDDPTVHSGV